jgi:hypothetical protein
VAKLELIVEVDGGSDLNNDGMHVRGTIRGEDGASHPFVGWVGLLSLVQRALIQEVPG